MLKSDNSFLIYNTFLNPLVKEIDTKNDKASVYSREQTKLKITMLARQFRNFLYMKPT